MCSGEFTHLAETDEQALSELPHLFILMDSDGFRRGDGSLTLEEWLIWTDAMPELREERFAQALTGQLEKAFSKGSFLKHTGPADRETRCRDLCRDLDLNEDGFIDLSEYLKARAHMSAGADDTDVEEAEAEATNEYLWMDVAQWRKCARAGQSVAHDLRLSPDVFVEAFLGMHAHLSDEEFASAHARGCARTSSFLSERRPLPRPPDWYLHHALSPVAAPGVRVHVCLCAWSWASSCMP